MRNFSAKPNERQKLGEKSGEKYLTLKTCHNRTSNDRKIHNRCYPQKTTRQFDGKNEKQNFEKQIYKFHQTSLNLTAKQCYRSLNALTEVEEPEEMGESLGTGAHRYRSILSILPPGVKYIPEPWVLQRILSHRS